MLSLLKRLTVDQWALVDREHRKESLPSLKPVAVLIAVAISLVVAHFWGKPTSVANLPGVQDFLQRLPTPELYPSLYWALFKVVNYLLIPVVCIKLVLRENVVDFGLTLRHSARIWGLYLAMFLVVLPLAYLVSSTPAFLKTYPKFAGAGESWGVFFVWEAAYGLQFFLLEFFFRGFALFALARYIGSLAIFVMVVPYAMIHFGKPAAECFGSIIAGTALGTIALRTRSIYGGVFVHCGIAWSMDVFAMLHKGTFQQLLQR
ncbi:MAG: CPBP family glutamic-type intramembrane protease [Polyangiaceae bacterium]|nr:CPBP family glutamic-type intramembrane protease [Polyangiaceae bacterium]